MNTLLQSEFSSRLCWTLAHSLWQVGAVAMVASLFAFALRRRSAGVRYNVYLAGLLVSLAAFPVTFWLLGPAIEVVAIAPSEPALAATTPAEPTAAAALPEVTTTAPILPAVETVSPALRAPQLAPEPVLSRFVPWIAIAYLLGVCAMAIRLATGMWSAGALSRRAAGAGCELTERLERIARQWKLRVVPRLAVSAEVVVPKVVGILRPVILLPLSATTGLAADQLDMILAHELAHVRRHDLWVNLLQRIAETLLFFNPAIWYLSRRLTTLREDASDELVCSGAPSQATRYAAALVRVAELSRPRAAAEIAAIAATGRSPSELRRRVARLVGEPLREPVRLTRSGVLTIAMMAVVALMGPGIWRSGAEPPVKELSDSESDQKSESNTTHVRELRSGAKVTLLGIGTHGETPARWWDGNGTPLEGVAYHLEGPRARTSDKAEAREVVFRVEDVPEDAVIRMETKPIDGTPAEVVWAGDKSPGKYGGMVFFVPKDRQTFKLRVGVAGGEWQTITEANGSQATGIAGNHGIVFSEAYARGDDSVVIVSHNMENENTRVVAVDLAGSEIVGERAGYVSAVGKVNQATWKFTGLLPGTIQKFKFQTRLFLWAEFDELPVEAKQETSESKKKSPFSVHGRVTDQDGEPMEGVVVRAATGIGTLRGGASTSTDADGRYTLHFGPGMKILEEYAPLGVGVQAAIISARKPGWHEVNLNRQGNLLMSDQSPESLKKEELWGRESIDWVVFPNQPREVNFTLAPAAVIDGRLVGDGTWKIDNQSLTLTGKELPPASSVFTSVTTDKNGKFTMDAVPTGKPWRFEMRISGTRGEVRSDPFTIAEPGVYRCVVSLDTETKEDGSVVLKLRQEAAETP